MPDYHIDTNGQIYLRNESIREVLINSLQEINSNDWLVLGLPFFTSAYMMVDNDREQFTIWKSQAKTGSNLVAMPASVCNNTTKVTVPSSTSSPFPPYKSGTTSENSRVSSGGIAGAVVAILAGIALCLCVFLLFRRKWARAQELKSPKNGSRPVSPILYKPELAADRQPPQEMPSAEDPSLAIAPYEMLEESSHQELPVDGSLCLIHEMPAATPGRRHFRTA